MSVIFEKTCFEFSFFIDTDGPLAWLISIKLF